MSFYKLVLATSDSVAPAFARIDPSLPVVGLAPSKVFTDINAALLKDVLSWEVQVSLCTKMFPGFDRDMQAACW